VLEASNPLRSLCEAVFGQPRRWTRLDGWTRHLGADPRTIARLFRREPGSSEVPWRQRVLLAHAPWLAARKLPVARIAAELGYASPSASKGMVNPSLGAPPSHFFG
jgi:transcriptional regulator GlxA family with amidase domain